MEYERLRDFIISYIHDDEGILGDIYSEAIKNNVPVIRPEMKDLLRTLIVMNRPEKVLEIGTAVGYSSLFIAEVLKCGFSIDTFELDPDRVKIAKDNISKLGYENEIHIHEGDAAALLKEMDRKYDFVFIDAAKAQYMIYLEEIMRLTHPGSVIVTDNIFTDGEVLESHFLVEKRDRTIHDRMREYIYKIKNDDRLETAVLSVADGAAVSVVK